MTNSQAARGQTADRARSRRPPGRAAVIPLTLEEESALLCTIFSHSPDAMAFIDHSLVIRAANQTFAEYVRVPLDKIIGRLGEEVIPGVVEQIGDIYRQVRATGKPFHAVAHPFLFRDQPERGLTYWSFSVSPVYGPSGTFLGYLVLSREVTQRERSEKEKQQLMVEVEELAAEAQKRAGEMETVIESIADAAFVCDAKGRITLANKPGLDLIGSLRGRTHYTLANYLDNLKLHFADGRPVRTQDLSITRALRGEVVRGLEEEGTHPTTSERLVLLVSAAPLRNAAGAIIGAVEVATNISNLRAITEEAQRRAEELEAILDSIADGVFVCDTESRIIDVNQAALRILGLSDKEGALMPEADYLNLLDLRHPDGRPIRADELVLSRALQGEVIRGFEQVARDLHTRRPIHFLISAAPLRDREGRIFGAVAVLSDITSIRELDRLKDQFITVAAHELKTPVAIMKGYAQGLLRTAEDMPAPRRRMLEAIDRGSNRIDSVVEDLLDISRLHLGHLELTKGRVDLPELAREVVDRVDLTSPQHRVRVAKTQPVVVQADRYRLEQVLTNLIDNAMRYSPSGGDIDVEVSVREDQAVVSVRDYGVGIPREKQRHIFERFYRAHTGTPFDYGGMGVGLYICREIIARHGGKIWFESEEGKGSTFYFGLPL